MTVVKGYLGRGEEDSLAIDEELTVFCARKEKMVHARDRHKRNILLPLDIKAKFFLLKEDAALDDDGEADCSNPGDAHADYEQLYTLAEIIIAVPLPCSVRMVEASEEVAGPLSVAASSAFAMCVSSSSCTRKITKLEDTDGGTEHHPGSVPSALALALALPPALPPTTYTFQNLC